MFEQQAQRDSFTAGVRLLLAIIGAFSSAAGAQGPRVDYDRSASFHRLTSNKVFDARVDPHWTVAGNAFRCRAGGPYGIRHFWWVDAAKGTRSPAFDHERMAAAKWSPDLLGGVMSIHSAFEDRSPLTAIPNYSRNNPGGRSVVWIRE